MTIYILKNLINNMGFLIVIAYFVTRIGLFKDFVTKKRTRIGDKILMSIIFGSMGILATYTGTEVNGAIANSRIIGVLVGGMFGGPIVGVGAGLVAGIHRWAIDMNGFTAGVCMLSTITEGLIGGLLAKYVRNHNYKWARAFFIGVFAESIQMLLVLLLAKPFPEALALVKIIWIPMVIFNPVGIAVFVALIDSIYTEQEKEAATKTQLALDIADRCLAHLKKGLSDSVAIKAVAKTILDMTNFSAISITSQNSIIAHEGVSQDHHLVGMPIQTALTMEVLKTGKIVIAQNQNQIGCNHCGCKLRAAVIVPLTKGKEIIGTIKMYKIRDNSIGDIDIRLAEGLARLFSTQFELGEVENQIKLREKAELKALQSQINPHFLFNTLNTIVFFCRTDPEKARELLKNLSTHLRSSLEFNRDFVELSTELKHVEAYLSIVRARFEDKIKIEMEIEEYLDCILPQLVLQPIVENAVKHGILKKKDGGVLKISARKNGEVTEIVIEDDGVGIGEDILADLESGTLTERKVGLANVYNRMKALYGSENSMHIERRVEGGTLVRLVIPRVCEVGA